MLLAAVLIGNLGGTTSALLGLTGADTARRLHLDTLYPINGYKRCLDSQNGYGTLCWHCKQNYLCMHLETLMPHLRIQALPGLPERLW